MRLPEPLLTLFETGRTVNARGESVPLHAAVTQAEASALYGLVRALRPRVSLEVGLGQGVSTLAILSALRANGAGHHHVVDPFEHKMGDAGIAAVEQAGLDAHWTFYRQHGEHVIPGLPALDFVFVDASHLFDLTLADFVLIDKRLRIGGLVGFHDLWLPAYQQLLDYVLRNRAYTPYNWEPRRRGALRRQVGRIGPLRRMLHERLFTLPPSANAPNLAILQKTAHDERSWDYHVRF